MTIPIGEIIDAVAISIGLALTFFAYSIWWPLCIIPIGFMVWHFVFDTRIGDGPFGYIVCSSRWDQWHGKMEYWRWGR